MNYSELELGVCRICLEHNTSFNWCEEIFDFPGVSYKDCYYKYTQMEESDADFYPTNLCGKCANDVKNAHTLFEKALQSFIILQNMVKANGYESFLDSCNDTEIDEVICYSPVYDDDVIEKGNAINDWRKTSIMHDKTTQNFEQPFRIPSEKQAMDTSDIKLLMTSVDKTEKNERKTLESLNFELELELQLEIRGSKLLNAKTFATKTCKSRLKKSLKNSQKVLKNKRDQRTEYSGQNSSLKISLGNTESQQAPLNKSSENNEKTNKPLKYSFKNPNVGESDTNSIEAFGPKRVKHRELQTSFVSDVSGKEEIADKQLDNSLLERNVTENYMSSAVSSNSNSSSSLESQKCSLTDKSIETKQNNFKPSEISLLNKIYGKHFDINSLKMKPEAKISQKRVKICQYCSLKLMGTSHLLAHEATHLEHRERNMICPKCGIRLYTKISLSEHIKTHDDNRQKKHKCEFCEKAFFHRGGLNVHRRIHLGLMVKCQICPKQFYRQIDLDIHMSSHSASALQNNGVKQKKYSVQCQYCNKSIRTSSWRAHKAAHLKQPQVQCKICNKDFYSRASCAEHLHKLHRKTKDEYEKNIHYHVNSIGRMSHLMLMQQETVLPVTK